MIWGLVFDHYGVGWRDGTHLWRRLAIHGCNAARCKDGAGESMLADRSMFSCSRKFLIYSEILVVAVVIMAELLTAMLRGIALHVWYGIV